MKKWQSIIPILFFAYQFSAQSCIDCTLIDPDAICITLYDPVCGCDGVTYSNDCVAVNSAGLTSYTSGVCPSNYVDQCVNLSGIDFGLCTAIIGYAMINGECQAVSGCSTIDDNGVDYSIAFYPTLDECSANCDCPSMIPDSDGDGVNDELDCNDMDPSIYLGAPEICDGIDNDCDDEIDEDLPTFTYYLDGDLDGYGVSDDSLITCADVEPIGWAGNTMDCDDSNSAIYPDAEEIPNNGIDENCDGEDSIIDGLEEMKANGLNYFPNPARDFLIIENTKTLQSLVVKIFDLTGKNVYQSMDSKARLEIDITEFDSGIYFILFETEDLSLSGRFIKLI